MPGRADSSFRFRDFFSDFAVRSITRMTSARNFLEKSSLASCRLLKRSLLIHYQIYLVTSGMQTIRVLSTRTRVHVAARRTPYSPYRPYSFGIINGIVLLIVDLIVPVLNNFLYV